MSERQGVEIDYCPSCRGIWLDRGELDKILDKALANEKDGPYYQQPQQGYKEFKHPESRDYYSHRKKHWLSEFFD
jgi:Zn-finger nucleic acid-binding protein